MTGLEKIIEEICNEAAKEAQSILEKAEAEAAEILEQAKVQMRAKEAETVKAAEAEVAELVRSRDSALHLQRRQRILATKQAAIAEALQKAKQTLQQLPDEEYFNLLAGLIKKAAQAQSGVLILNEKDKARLPADFIADLLPQLPENAALTVADQCQPIDGGFILKYGDILENCAFETLFNTKLGEFSDLAMKTMFDD